MEVSHVPHMVGGSGDTSYASNSKLQEKATSMAKFLVQEAIVDLWSTLHPEGLAVADLGCSSGPNAYAVISEIIEAIGGASHRLHRPPPEIHFFLNDLPGNDFNNIFRSLNSYERKVKEEMKDFDVPFYVMGVPGSFYGRLFPKKSVSFMHSSFALHWLSQVPEGLRSENKGNIYIAKTSPPSMFQSYQEQYQRDFFKFLKLRSEEIICEGRMVLSLLGRKNSDPSDGEYSYAWGLLAEALNAQVLKGHISEEKVHAFNLPIYSPSIEEVRMAIHNEGSFNLVAEHIHQANWDGCDDYEDGFPYDSSISGKNVAKIIRSVMEPMLALHFGEEIINDLFADYADNLAKHLSKEKTKATYFFLSLKKRV